MSNAERITWKFLQGPKPLCMVCHKGEAVWKREVRAWGAVGAITLHVCEECNQLRGWELEERVVRRYTNDSQKSEEVGDE